VWAGTCRGLGIVNVMGFPVPWQGWSGQRQFKNGKTTRPTAFLAPPVGDAGDGPTKGKGRHRGRPPYK